jgi:hypothetical protein
MTESTSKPEKSAPSAAPTEVARSDKPEIPVKTGRPSDFTQELADLICEEIALGASMRTVCKAEDRPAVSTVFRWIREDETFQKQYARACEERTEAMAEDVLDISDDGRNDWMRTRGGYVVNRETTERSKLRIETRKWLMAKMKPKKYGDKIDVTSAGERITTSPVVISQIAPRNVDAAESGDAESQAEAS